MKSYLNGSGLWINYWQGWGRVLGVHKHQKLHLQTHGQQLSAYTQRQDYSIFIIILLIVFFIDSIRTGCLRSNGQLKYISVAPRTEVESSKHVQNNCTVRRPTRQQCHHFSCSYSFSLFPILVEQKTMHVN